MIWPTSWFRPGGHGYVLAITIVLVLMVGLVLWAEIPGPQTGRHISVSHFHPSGQTDPATNITIRFSDDLVPVDSLNRAVVEPPVQFSPEIPGLARWTASDILVFYPGAPLDPATAYTATIKSGGGWVNGRVIQDSRSFTFSTRPLAVEVSRYHAQRTRADRRRARLLITLTFNYPVARENLSEALKIRGGDAAAKSRLELVWPDSTESGPEARKEYRLVTEPFDLNGKEQQYRLQIEKGLLCRSCGAGLTVDYEYIMAVPRSPKMDLWVERVTGRRPGKQGIIDIQFSSPVPVEEVRERVSLDPPVKFTVETSWRGALLRGDFKPQAVYDVNIDAGLMSRDGTMMDRDFSGRVQMGDLDPAVRFTSPGLFLPSDGSKLLEVETVNIDTLSVEVTQIFANNLVPYLATGFDRGYRQAGPRDPYGRRTFIQDFGLAARQNEPLLSTVDVGAIIGDSLQGVFAVLARGRSNRWVVDSRRVMLTDIGIQARMSEDYLLVWANSLSEARPIGKAEVKLFSRNNQLLLEGKTNSKGVAVFNDIGDQVDGFQPFLITVEKKGELSYLRLDNTRLPTNGFDVSGRPYLTEGYEAFLYFDRGVFRPGETVHLVSMVRGRDGAVAPSFPYLVKITDPRGRKFRELRLSAEQTMSGLDIGLPADLATGRYNVTAQLADEYVLGRGSFLVEEFVPDRIKVTVATDSDVYRIGDTMSISVAGRMLYGPPAAGHKATGEIVLTPSDFRSNDHPDHTFRDVGREMAETRLKLGEARLSDSGAVVFTQPLVKKWQPPSQLTARVWATVSETGGRAVSSFTETTVHPYPRYIGLKTELDGYARIDEPVAVHLVALTPDRQSTPVNSITVRFSRLVYNSMLQQQADGSYRYVSEKTDELIDSVSLSLGPDGGAVSFTPADYGEYRIVAVDPVGGHAAAVEFYASGWGRVPWSLAQPDRLKLDLDRSSYRPGERAKLQVAAPFGGRLLVTIENQTVRDYMAIDMPENTAEIEIPIERDFAPNVYLSATLIRPAGEISKHTPARAYGIVPLIVTPRERQLTVEMQAPSTARPRTRMIIGIDTDGGPNTHLTIAAVDAGILQLTDFTTPDPFEFFCGKRRPLIEGYDLYSQIYPETERAQSHLSPPGGLSEARRKRHLNPFAARRVKPVSLWSGVVTADSSGRAEVPFDLPQFGGQLVLMAVVGDGDRFGSTNSTVLVRDLLVIQESFPRFVAPGDSVDGLVTVFNGMDTTATIEVTVNLSGPAKVVGDTIRQLTVESNREGAVRFPFRADIAPGIVKIELRAQAGSEESGTALELANRPGQPLKVEYGSGVVTADSPAAFIMPDDWLPGTAEYTLRTTSMAAAQVTRNIEYLLRYPYGCIEQTTSALFPLLYFDDLARVIRPDLLGGKAHEYYLAEGIDRLLRFQRDDGSFSYWPGGDRLHNWSAIYAAHFLIEARLAGYEIEKNGYKRALGFLGNMARGKKYSDIKTEHRIYACLALAKAGKLDKKLFNYLGSLNVDQLSPGTRHQMASALAIAGDVTRAREYVPFDIQPDLSEPDDGGDFASGVRTNAILLDLLLAVDPQNPSVFALAKSLLDDARLNRWYNTQATSFALMSLGKFFGRTDPAPFTGEIKIDGLDEHRIDKSDFRLTRDDLGGRDVTITLDDGGPCFYYWQASGIPSSPAPVEFDRGIVVRREFLDAGGATIDTSIVPLGSRLVGHVSISATGKRLRNVVIADLLPAGFEIENPRLAGTPDMPWLPKDARRPEYQDIRDDRLLLFTDLPSNKTLHFYYGLRAVAAGEFAVPPVAAECMYNPLVAGAGSSGRLVIGEQ